MKLNTKKEYYSITHNSGELHITLEDLTEGPRPIVWKNFGLLRVIPYARVVNMLHVLLDLEKAKGPDNNAKVAGKFFWDDLKEV